jgi:signal peptidase II
LQKTRIDLKILNISLIIVFVDQVTKLFVKGFSIPVLNITYQGMYQGQRIEVIGDFFRITFIENPGMAFGFDPGSDFKLYISLFSLAASIGLLIYFYFIRNQSLSLRISIAFILGGAVGNLIDRMFYGILYGYAPMFYGGVVDFLDFDFFNVTVFGRNYERWPIFNVADAAVTIGVLVLIIFYKKHQEEDAEIYTELETGLINEPESSTSSEQENSNSDSDIEIKPPDRNSLQDGESDKGEEIPL